MRDLAIAYGNSRQAKKWSNKTVKFDDLKKSVVTLIVKVVVSKNIYFFVLSGYQIVFCT